MPGSVASSSADAVLMSTRSPDGVAVASLEGKTRKPAVGAGGSSACAATARGHVELLSVFELGRQVDALHLGIRGEPAGSRDGILNSAALSKGIQSGSQDSADDVHLKRRLSWRRIEHNGLAGVRPRTAGTSHPQGQIRPPHPR